jgi:hypothetical protein
MQNFNTNIYLFNFFSMLAIFQFKQVFHVNNFQYNIFFQCKEFSKKKLLLFFE